MGRILCLVLLLASPASAQSRANAVATGIFFAAHSADAISTSLGVRYGLEEANPLLPRDPMLAGLTKCAITGVATAVLWHYRDRWPRPVFYLVLASSAVAVGAAAHNVRQY